MAHWLGLIVIMGDFNGTLGNQPEEYGMGDCGLWFHNDRGDKLTEWAKSHDTIIGSNTWY